MNVLDLFSGIGGFSLGLERAGMRTVAFCEIEPYARGVLAQHWPHVPCHEDVTTREFTEGEADIICGGFPCQDLSTAGLGAGLSGKRSGLWRELLRAIRVVRPRYAIVENVAALLSRGMGTVLGDLAQVGYDAEWHCIPASAIGAPHRRDRVWIIADPGSQQHEGNRPPISGKITEELSRAAADAYGEQLWEQSVGEFGCRGAAVALADGSEGPLADANDQRELQSQGSELDERRRPRDGCWWLAEPDVGRVAHGVPARVDRLRGLGNAVVPQIPEIIGRAIMRSIA